MLHLMAGSDPGGLSRYVYDLCHAFHESGHSVTVAGERGAWHGLFERAAWPWIEVPLKGGPVALWRATGELRRYLGSHPVDLLHVHYRRPALVARRLANALSIPFLYTLHLSDIPMTGVWRYLSDFGDHTHAASEDARGWLTDVAGVPGERITVIPHGIQVERYPITAPEQRSAARRQLAISDGALVAAFVGRLDVPKNEGWVLDLATATRRSLPDAVFVLAGDGPHEAHLRRRIESEGLAGRVRLLGHQDNPLGVYQAASALLLPSQREGFSLVCAEAMATGIPVLRTRTAGTTETVVEGVTGRSTPIDRDAFIGAAIEFLRDRGALVRMGAAAADHVRAHLTFDRQVAATLALYRRLVSIGRTAARTD